MLPDFDRADRISEFWENPKTRTFAAPDRLRGESGTSGGAHRDAAGRELSLPGHWANREPSPADTGLAGRLDCRPIDARAQMPY
jgi:hypothetical protein